MKVPSDLSSGATAWGAVLLALLLLGACGDASGTSSGAPDALVLPPERVRGVVETYVKAFATRDRALYVSLFAESGTVEDPVGSTPVVGHEALGAFFDAATAAGPVRLEIAPDGVRVAGNHVAFAFTLRLDAGGRELLLPVIDTFDLDPDGRIRAMRAYWNPGDLRPGG
jgi:steroid delta-isomerase